MHLDMPVQPVPAVSAAGPSPALIPLEAQVSAAPIRRPDLKGVGGWLLFFCVSLTVLAPVLVLSRGEITDFSQTSIIDLALVAFGILVGGFVWNVHRSSFVLLWIYFGANSLLLVLAIVGYAVSEEQGQPQEIIQLVRGLVSTVIWFLYFKKSNRVQATFGRNL
jgi:hypothetical protein